MKLNYNFLNTTYIAEILSLANMASKIYSEKSNSDPNKNIINKRTSLSYINVNHIEPSAVNIFSFCDIMRGKCNPLKLENQYVLLNVGMLIISYVVEPDSQTHQFGL